MRDVRELGVSYDRPYGVRNTEYIDRIYEFDKPFRTDKTRVLVIGYSFARDFACCLLEWQGANDVELSYMPMPTEDDDRYAMSDYIFIFGDKASVPAYIWDKAKDPSKLYGIGTKTYGRTFGNRYARRNSSDYYSASIPVPPKLVRTNTEWKRQWGDNYVDFVSASLDNDGNIRLLTPDSMVISFDGLHLTPAGARYLASRIDFNKIFTPASGQNSDTGVQ